MKSNFKKITESSSLYNHLELMDTTTLLEKINNEDKKIAQSVEQAIPQIGKLVDMMVERFERGGRVFYLGAGTSGRLGILDASEIPPTFGMPHDRIIGLIAGGDTAIRKAVEFAEDDMEMAWEDLKKWDVNTKDMVIGIAASGTTPYVIGGVSRAQKKGILTACITNNPGSPLAKAVEIPIEVNVGPEFVTGSTRMKSGTSQKLVLNMISTTLMIRTGRVRDNKMVNMQLSNRKLIDRGSRMVMEELGVGYEKAQSLLKEHGSVKKVLETRNNQ